jgi:hypothetical protein
MRCIQARLDEIFAFRLSDEWLELRCGESVHETCFGHDEEKDLSASKGGQLVCLMDQMLA